MEEKIQTLHPQPGKINKKISLVKYEYIKHHLLAILATTSELSHTDLMEALYIQIHEDFDGGVQWYGEVVKLDLEARHMIERSKVSPVVYRLKK